MFNISKRTLSLIISILIVALIISILIYLVKVNPVYKTIWDKIKTYLGIILTIYSIFIATVIFLENKNPSKTIAWLLILILVPVVGFIFYIFLGHNIRRKMKFEKKKYSDFKHLTYAVDIQKELLKGTDIFKNVEESLVKSKLINLLLKVSNSPFTSNNRTKILKNGDETFKHIIDEIKNAKHHIHMEYFIIKDDDIGNKIREILIGKAKEGVKVRVIYDDVGCWRLSKNYINSLKASGVEIYPFYPVIFPVLSRELNYRNHRKIVVVDGRVGFIGGLNIGDEYLGLNPRLGFWRDTHIKIEGEAVYGIQNTFLKDWEFVSGKYISGKSYYPKLPYYGEQIIQITPSGPDTEWRSIMKAYFTMIATAEERVWIATPYLVPEDSINTALMTAALSGIDVRIIIPSKPDHILVYWASRSNIEDLLKAGVKIYTYEKGFIHSKLLLVDGEVASVGTANLDIRSLEMNFEINSFIYDKEVVKELEKDFIEDLSHSKEVILEEHLKRNILVKFKESIGRLLSPLL
ncbi:cardiolipin synthase [Thermohalobacter berrensis]|uniref:Cardiolipin synthase n=1 Tax=Thermohalobacter berrensis TaxID=99594 RepID=A0A419T7U2_9FIRM|nr:cardiolipin synthase [Thermohalobacter berrensis]RKD33515.1 cardiolipin synthase [Thermohalobacter berrensis]